MGVAGEGNSSFGDGLAAAARSIIADGRQALTDPELSDAEAVHELRKALKRGRALLRLLARPLGEQPPGEPRCGFHMRVVARLDEW